MSHIQHLDELIREYLLFRGFTNTLKIFDAELRNDKDKGFRVDKIVEQILHHITTYDLNALRDLWAHLDQRIFSKLEAELTPGIRKLESSVLKYYLVNAVVNNKGDKVTDFFAKLTPELQGQADWKEWFMLPFIKNPEEHPVFSIHFNKQWQDSLLVSLHNFLAIVFQAMPQPVLSSYEEEAMKLRKLQEENEALKHKLATLTQCSNVVPDAIPPIDIMDDFYIIAQETPSSDGQSKSLKSLIRNIGGGIPTSPVLGRKTLTQDSHVSSRPSAKANPPHSGWTKHSVEGVPKRSLSLDSRTRRGQRDLSCENLERKVCPKKDKFLLLSQEAFKEHQACVTQCQFNSVGSMVASCDIDGVVTVWSPSPTPRIFSNTHYKDGGILSLDWVPKNERYFVTGSESGILRLHDSTENKTISEIGRNEVEIENAKILNISCSPTDRNVALATIDNCGKGRLLLFSLNYCTIEKSFDLGGGSWLTANSCMFNHNGNILIAGCSDGSLRMLDIRNEEWLESWEAHSGQVISLQVTPDHTMCYSFGSDHKLVRHNLAKFGSLEWSGSIPDCFSCHGNQAFSLHQTGKHVLTTCGRNGAKIYQISGDGLKPMLDLPGHRSPLVACDWTTANQCATCLSASTDGKIKISTILTP